MAEQTERKIKTKKKAKKALLASMCELHEHEKHGQTIKWFLDTGFAAMTPTYNQFAEIMWDLYWVNLCICDANFVCKQYSQKYTHLTKFNPAWVGFYPSTYEVTEVVDEAGTEEKKTISDVKQLQSVRGLNTGSKFYFAGLKYAVTKVEHKHDSDDSWGWMLYGNCPEHSEGIFIRATKDAYVIMNYAMNDHKTRQTYGDARTVGLGFGKFVKAVLLNDEDDNPFLTEVEEAINNSW